MREEQIFDNEPVIINETKGINSKYDNPEVISFIIEKKNEGNTFSTIKDLLKKRGYDKIEASMISNLYKLGLARSVTYHNTAQKEFTDFSGELKKSYQESIELLGIMVRTLRGLVEQIKESDPDSITGKSLIIKVIPQAVQIMKEIREHVKLQTDLQDQIVTTAQEEVKLTTSDIVEKVNEYLPIMLKDKLKDLETKYGNTIPLNKLKEELQL